MTVSGFVVAAWLLSGSSSASADESAPTAKASEVLPTIAQPVDRPDGTSVSDLVGEFTVATGLSEPVQTLAEPVLPVGQALTRSLADTDQTIERDVLPAIEQVTAPLHVQDIVDGLLGSEQDETAHPDGVTVAEPAQPAGSRTLPQGGGPVQVAPVQTAPLTVTPPAHAIDSATTAPAAPQPAPAAPAQPDGTAVAGAATPAPAALPTGSHGGLVPLPSSVRVPEAMTEPCGYLGDEPTTSPD